MRQGKIRADMSQTDRLHVRVRFHNQCELLREREKKRHTKRQCKREKKRKIEERERNRERDRGSTRATETGCVRDREKESTFVHASATCVHNMDACNACMSCMYVCVSKEREREREKK